MPNEEPPSTIPKIDSSTTDPAKLLTRLYISPLTAETLTKLITPEQRALITNTSFHTLETFPEKPYGYLTLPQSLAQSIRKKYHGNIFRGVKMKVEEARPERRKRKTGAEAEAEDVKAAEKEERRSKRKKGSKAEEGVLKGIELPDGRTIKRGWSEGGDEKKSKRDEKKSKKSKKEDGDRELVFRTSVPPTSAPTTTNGAEASKTKAKKPKRGATEGNLVEVKEHDNTTKFPTFVRNDSSGTDKKPTSEFVDGKGWVDADGKVIEAAPSASKRRTRAAAAAPTLAPKSASSASSSEVSPSSASSEDEADANDDKQSKEPTPNISITSADSTSADLPQPSKEPSALEALFKRPNSASKSKNMKPSSISTRSSNTNASSDATLQAPFTFFPTTAPTSDPARTNTVTTTLDIPTDPNHLSSTSTTLGKRKPTTLQINPPPTTPFTRRDLDARSLRSAAPTPDTAAIGRRFRPPWGSAAAGGAREREGSRDTPESVGSLGRSSLGAEVLASTEGLGREGTADSGVDVKREEDDEDDGDEDDPAGPVVNVQSPVDAVGEASGAGTEEGQGAGAGEGEAKEQTEFEKHFYEHRGEYNRAWKAQKREARKGARQTENRRGLRGKG